MLGRFLRSLEASLHLPPRERVDDAAREKTAQTRGGSEKSGEAWRRVRMPRREADRRAAAARALVTFEAARPDSTDGTFRLVVCAAGERRRAAPREEGTDG